jgi:hypothetical protein
MPHDARLLSGSDVVLSRRHRSMSGNEQHMTGRVLQDFPGGAAQGVARPGGAARAHDNEVGVGVAGYLGDGIGGHAVLDPQLMRSLVWLGVMTVSVSPSATRVTVPSSVRCRFDAANAGRTSLLQRIRIRMASNAIARDERGLALVFFNAASSVWMVRGAGVTVLDCPPSARPGENPPALPARRADG